MKTFTKLKSRLFQKNKAIKLLSFIILYFFLVSLDNIKYRNESFTYFLVDENHYKMTSDYFMGGNDLYVLNHEYKDKYVKKVILKINEIYRKWPATKKNLPKAKVDDFLNKIGPPRISFEFGSEFGSNEFEKLSTGDTLSKIYFDTDKLVFKETKTGDYTNKYYIIKHYW